MSDLLLNFSIITILSLLILFLLNKIAKSINLFDIPSEKKKHEGNIPLIGGLYIYFSLILCNFFFEFNSDIIILLIISSILIIIGTIDDFINLKVSIRLISQTIVAILLIFFVSKITTLGYYNIVGEINLNQLGIIFTILCIIVLLNSINFIDGIDGLAAIQVLLPLIFLIILMYSSGKLYDLYFILCICILLLIFMFFNFSEKYKIFLGDSGSTFLAFVLGYLMIKYSQPTVNLIHPILVPWLLSIPVFDFLRVTIIRIYNKRSPFANGREHIHYIMIENNISKLNIILIISLLTIFFNFIGFLSFYFLNSLFCGIILLITFIFYSISLSKFFKS